MADQDQTQEASFLNSTQEAPAVAPTEVKADDLVGDGKKFANVDDLAYGKSMADRHISNLEAENQRLRDQVESASSQGNLLEELKAQMSSRPQDSIQAEATVPSGETVTAPSQVDFSQQVLEVLNREKQLDVANTNLATVRDSMVSKFGDKWSEQGAIIAASNGLSMEALNSIASSSPSAFFKLAGISDVAPSSAPSGVQGSVNTEAVTTQQTFQGTKNATYYSKLRKEMGASKYYNNQALVQEEMSAATSQGDSFYI